ncbi:pyridoxal-phosphate dependent enzyme [Ascidiimonas sp. W6]|uniref:pyridoxal-phosphate dependent enzyme n=1 Tax=Ascidiimonas meishanensis TaxID=3128903 RepID=UPI0030EF42A1
MKLIEKINRLEKLIGNTPNYQLDFQKVNLYAKLEFNSFMGSIKDRPAVYAFKKAIESGEINESTTIVESSSGNFATGLAGVCKCLGLKFIAVVDPFITEEKEKNLSFLAHKIIKVAEKDYTGGYLLSRIETVKRLVAKNENYFSINQYSNPNNYGSYYNTLAIEIIRDFDRLDYLFVAVSTGGTVTGLSLRLKEQFPNLKVIAVDIEGSLAMGGIPKPRSISGMGSSKESEFIKLGSIDHQLILSQQEIINGCNELFYEQMIFAGGSSGAVYTAAKMMLEYELDPNSKALIICPDRGHAYINKVYKNQEKNEISRPKKYSEIGS